MTAEGLVDAEELGQVLGVAPSSVVERVRRGGLPEPVQRSPLRWERAAVEAWIEGHRIRRRAGERRH